MFRTVYVAHIEDSESELVLCVLHVQEDHISKIIKTCISKTLARRVRIGQTYICKSEDIVSAICSQNISTDLPELSQ